MSKPDSDPRLTGNPVDALRDVAQRVAENLGLDVDFASFDEARALCDKPVLVVRGKDAGGLNGYSLGSRHAHPNAIDVCRPDGTIEHIELGSTASDGSTILRDIEDLLASPAMNNPWNRAAGSLTIGAKQAEAAFRLSRKGHRRLLRWVMAWERASGLVRTSKRRFRRIAGRYGR